MYDFVDFEVYFGGAFNDSGEKCYKGGDVTLFQSFNAGALNFSKVKEMLVGCCNRPVSKFYFHVPNTSLDEGLRLLCPETFPVMIEMALESKEVMEIYIQHVELESESESDSEFDAYVASLDNNSEEGDGDDDNNDDDDDDDDDDDASLDHMSEDDDDEELISARVRLQEEEIKKTEKMRVQNDDLSCSKGKKKLTDCGNISGDIGDYASEYAESDEDGGSVSESDDNQSSSNISKRGNWPVFDPNTPWDKQVPENGMRFASQEQLRHMVINYSVSNGRSIRFARSARNKVLAVCGRDGSCPWRLYATSMQGEDMQIKSLNSSHSCVKRFKSSLVNTRWIAKEYETVIRANTNWKLKDIQKAILDRHHVPVSLSQCYRAKQYVEHDRDGHLINHYKKLWDYASELKRSNPGSTVELVTKQMNPGSPSSPEIFEKMYICLNALKMGWTAGCRPVIGLDGCFLKTYCRGELLSAIGRDGNNNMFPIAWAVVDVETTESWHWFLTNLINDIGQAFGGGLGLTFISDQQKV
ncbi:hypothetical protein CASFOL_025306 [Castilleja foliolosa]|uniref:Transposase MuDR plant domain-containing protein n=1 Tax=Castilleja foliolosa TaxID=1961234 RepID=A0ABD3CRS4_9LAMI